MFLASLATFSLLLACVCATPTPVIEARASAASPSSTIYMRIEGPTKTIYEKTIVAVAKTSLTNNGHTAKCNGTPKTAAGVTNLVALQQTGQFFISDWNGTTFGEVTKLNGTSNNDQKQWGSLFNDGNGGIGLQGYDSTTWETYCYQTLPNLQHFLFAFFGDYDETQFLIMSGPKTATVGQTVQYTVSYAPAGTYVNDLSVDGTTTGQRVRGTFTSDAGENGSVSIKFTKAGSYNMKAHCPSGTACVRSNHVVTVVS